MSTVNKPMASVIPQFLDGVIRGLVSKNQLSSYLDEDAAKLSLDTHLGHTAQLEIDLGEDDFPLEPEPTQEPTHKERIAVALEHYISDVGPGAVDDATELFQEPVLDDVPPIDISNPPWKDLPLTDFPKIKTAIPKNQWVELAKDNPLAELVIRVVCSHYEHWGSGTFDEVCKQTYEIFMPYWNEIHKPDQSNDPS